jgi:hypothetical protein
VYDRVLAGVQASDALVIKTCFEMEGPYIRYLAAQHGKPVLVTGPVVPEPPKGELEERWAQWLSSFPDSAVVFASFGSETFLPAAAATELLLGLEASNRPFLVVLNFPRGRTWKQSSRGARRRGSRREPRGGALCTRGGCSSSTSCGTGAWDAS